MWYFAWILGVLLACSFAIINAMWLDMSEANNGSLPLSQDDSMQGVSKNESS